ncbi:MAG: C cytochrome precursor, partial [Planctomycetes bacterium]|nr:C cytochrome precursor [Planctomycetota bacterium]
MSSDLLAWAVVAAAAAALGTAVLARRRPLQVTLSLALAGLATAAIVATFVMRERALPEAEVAGRPIEVPKDGYVTSSKCRSCHPHEHDTWHDSYHRTMTQRAHAQAVIGDFDDVTLTIDGKDYHLTTDGQRFFVELDDPMAKGPEVRRVRREVVMTTGSHNMQAYWYEFGHTRNIGMLPFTWLVEEGRWISRRSAFVGPESDPVEPKVSVWNMICIKCHTTHGRPRLTYQGATQTGAFTEVGEVGIACEACHGPGAEHVA